LPDWVQEAGRVLAWREVVPGHGRLDVRAPALAARARPGQFAMVRAAPALRGGAAGMAPFLGRPLSFFDMDTTGGVVSFLVRVTGEGTRALAACRPGDVLVLLGPFGNGFPAANSGTLLLVAGGVGVAPFPPVARAAVSAGARVTALVGARSAPLVLGVRELRDAGAEVVVCTEDGSRGRCGMVTDVLPQLLDGFGAGPSAAFACGPPAMLAPVARLLEQAGLELHVSLEARMGCGFGVCRGCAVPAARGGYLHVCQDGPVFPARAVDLEAVARLWGAGTRAR